MKTTDLGRQAEQVVADHLRSKGYKIIARNWKNKYCEIDIVCQKASTMYFIEVKYRSSVGQGTGFDYITAKKQKQMGFAANYWCAANSWTGDVLLMAAEVSGSDCQNLDLVEIT